MTIETIINRLIGQAESGETPSFASAEARALSQRLRALVAEDAGSERGSPDRGLAAEALQLAAYLDGGMDATARAEFERDLVRSPDRREELLDTAAWLDALAARTEQPPADATALLLAMDTPARARPEPKPRGFVAFVESLFPRPRLAIATSALASLAIAVVSLDVALHMIPLQMQPNQPVIEQTEQTRPPMWMNPSTLRPTDAGRVLLTAETINALIAYQADPSEPQRAEVLRCLTRAGAPAFEPGNVQRVTLTGTLSERLKRRDGALPATIAASLALDGTLRIESAD